MSSSNTSKIFNSKDLLAYLIVAGTGALVQLICSSLIQEWFDVSYSVSINWAYLISLIVGFILTKLFAFNARKTNQTRREMVKFVMVALFSGGVTWFFAVGSLAVSRDVLHIPTYLLQLPFARKTINVNEMTCHIIGMGFSFISNYILHKTFTFKSTGFYDRLKALLTEV